MLKRFWIGIFVFCSLFFLISNVSSATNVSSCQAISSAGDYLLNQSITYSAGSHCITVSAQNVTLDCDGFSIIGDNSSDNYGVYTNQFNTTIKNCVINNFHVAAEFSNSDNSSIIDSNLNSTYLNLLKGVLDSGYSDFLNITNVSVFSSGVSVSLTYGNDNFLNLVNATSSTTSSFLYGYADRLVMSNSNFTSLLLNTPGYHSVYFFNGDGLNISNSSFYSFQPTDNSLATFYNAGLTNSNFYGLDVFSQIYVAIWEKGSNNTYNYVNATGVENAFYQEGSSSYVNIFNSNLTVEGNGGYGALMLNGGSYFNVTNNLIQALSGTNSDALVIAGASKNNLFEQCRFISNEGKGIDFQYNSNRSGNSFINSEITSEGIGFNADHFESLLLNNVTITSNSSNALKLISSANFEIANSSFYSGGNSGNISVNITSDSSNGVFYNNTFGSSELSADLLKIDSSSGNNTFYWNNFSQTSGIYVNDSNGTNNFNTTIGSSPAGNFWHNVLSGGVSMTGNGNSIFSGYSYASSGTGYPYSNSTSLGKIFGNVVDWGPLVVTPISNNDVPSSSPSGGCVYYAKEISIEEGYSKSLYKGCRIIFEFENHSYSFDLNNLLTPNIIYFKVLNEDVYYDFESNGSVRVDLDNDGIFYDLLVENSDLYGNSMKITLKKISEEISPNSSQDLSDSSEEDSQEIQEPSQEKFFKKIGNFFKGESLSISEESLLNKNYIRIPLILVISLVIIVGIFLLSRYIYSNRSKKPFSERFTYSDSM
ncbi:MAG: right-handed parallel beta-helix repeat-containing protein [Nanoarchaeota archaeon]|nr:right-handed parallel beta-helix repeat-containing protein [Nanoarchaeota archaeon]